MGRLLAVVTLAGCAGGVAPAPSPVPQAPASVRPAFPTPPVAPTGLAVHLVWIGPADLDLLVTDPRDRTFSVDDRGGVLVADVGCEAAQAGGAVETARWPAPEPGRYRIGVDFAAGCGPAEPVEYRILIDTGGRRREVGGIAEPLIRAPSVEELRYP